MALWITFAFIILTVITIVLLVYYLKAYRDAYQCDADPNIFCYTDWLCDAGIQNAANVTVPKDKMFCHLKGLYTGLSAAEMAPGGVCEGFTNRGNPCVVNDQTPNTCENGQVNTDLDGNIFSCSCFVGDNITSSYNPACQIGDVECLQDGGDVEMGTNPCGVFGQKFGACSTV